MVYDRDFLLLAGGTLLGLLALPFVIRAIRSTRSYKQHQEDLSWDPSAEIEDHAPPPTVPETPSAAKALEDPMDAKMIETLLAKEAAPAILMRRAWPIGTDVPGASWLGGWPCLPADWDWPCHNRTGLPMHFLAQVDCADLPDLDGTSPLPRDGRMLFFADLDEERLWEDTTDTSRVVYVPKDQEVDMPRSWPANMPDIDHPDGEATGPDAMQGQHGFQPWPVTFHPITTWPGAPGHTLGAVGNRDYMKAAFARQTATIHSLLPPSETTPLLSDKLIKIIGGLDPEGHPVSDGDGKPTPYPVFNAHDLGPAFPWCGAFVTAFVAKLHEKARRAVSYNENWLKRAPIEDQRLRATQGLSHATGVLNDILSFADAIGAPAPTAPLPPAFRPVLIDWIQALLDRHNWHAPVVEALRDAASDIARQAVTDPDILPLIDAPLVDLNPQLSPAPDHCHHILLGHAQFKTNSTEGRGVRLAVLDSDGGVGFQFGDAGVAEFWIEPDDLAGRRFERAYALTAGG